MKESYQPRREPTADLISNPSRYSQKPLRALLIIFAALFVCMLIVSFILYGILKLPQEFSNSNALSTVILFTICNIIAYLFVPYFLRIPNGKRTFREYLSDIGLTRIQPFLQLFILTISCLLILILCQGSGSLVYRLTEGKPLTVDFIRKVFDLSLALPPKSILLFTVFYSMFEEVCFRGVFLTMLLRKYSQLHAILYASLAFGVFHIFAVFAGGELVTTIAQVVWAFIFGIFYGYIFVKTGSLWPSMIIHWLSNVFQSSLTVYWLSAPLFERALFGIIFGYGLAAILSIFWVRFYSSKWLKPQKQRLN
ncbi:MAG TPA: type II CAAX endopeptidase family protein [Bacteroidales bacterium]|nr:type II CAAX endopeptidase family protein [Bacteroidales bacterium]